MSKRDCPPTLRVCHVRAVLQLTSYAIAFIFILILATTLKTPPAHAIVALTTPSRVNRQVDSTRTRTPTPTWIKAAPPSRSAFLAAPQSVPGQPQVDANTLALYHFDSPSETVAIDATGRYTGTLVGNATITSLGVYAGALRLDGASGYVAIGYLNDTLSKGTIEAFVDFSEACSSPSDAFPIVTVVGPSGVILSLEENSGLRFGIYANNTWNWADSGINGCRYLKAGNISNPPPWENVPIRWPYEVWRFHHVAATWGPRGMEIWVDGVLHGVGNDDPNANIYPYPYMCNPQDQMMSSIYPLCKTPVMAPTMPAYPRGDYTGGLLPYHTVFIGYNPSLPAVPPSNPYFKGRIEEVRISNIQRTFSVAVVPTITPTPTQTPVPIGGEYSVDSQTQALFHLNYQVSQSVLEEVSHQYKYLSSYSYITPAGRFGAGLTLIGNDSSFDPGNLGTLAVGTLEAWVLFQNPSPNQPMIVANQAGLGYGSTMFFGSTIRSNNIGLGLFDGVDTTQWLSSGVAPASLVGCWHHIAGTWGPRGMEIWIDGIVQSRNNYTGGMAYPTWYWRIGGDFTGNSMIGVLDEVRVSSVQRTFTRQALAVQARSLPSPRAPTLGTPVFLPLIMVFPTPACPFGP